MSDVLNFDWVLLDGDGAAASEEQGCEQAQGCEEPQEVTVGCEQALGCAEPPLDVAATRRSVTAFNQRYSALARKEATPAGARPRAQTDPSLSYAEMLCRDEVFAPLPRRARAQTEPRAAPAVRCAPDEPYEEESNFKSAAAAKYAKKARHSSFGHTLRAKHWSQVGPKCTHVLVPWKGANHTATDLTEMDAVLPTPDQRIGYLTGRTATELATGRMVPLKGPLKFAPLEELAAALGGTSVPAKVKGGVGESSAVETIEMLLPSGKTKQYTVCTAKKETRYVKHQKCAAAVRPGYQHRRLDQEMEKHKVWREEIRGGLAAHRAECA